jgi:hypothetical protein
MFKNNKIAQKINNLKNNSTLYMSTISSRSNEISNSSNSNLFELTLPNWKAVYIHP